MKAKILILLFIITSCNINYCWDKINHKSLYEFIKLIHDNETLWIEEFNESKIILDIGELNIPNAFFVQHIFFSCYNLKSYFTEIQNFYLSSSHKIDPNYILHIFLIHSKQNNNIILEIKACNKNANCSCYKNFISLHSDVLGHIKLTLIQLAEMLNLDEIATLLKPEVLKQKDNLCSCTIF